MENKKYVGGGVMVRGGCGGEVEGRWWSGVGEWCGVRAGVWCELVILLVL